MECEYCGSILKTELITKKQQNKNFEEHKCCFKWFLSFKLKKT